MLNIVYTHASVGLIIFHYYVLPNKQSNRCSLYGMTSVVVLFAYPVEYLDKEGSYINSTKKVV